MIALIKISLCTKYRFKLLLGTYTKKNIIFNYLK